MAASSCAARARLQVLLAAALFSTGGAAIKATRFTSFQVAGLRSAVATAVFLLLSREARRGYGRGALLCGAAYATTLVLFVAANKLTTAANAIFLQDAAPLYIVLFGPWLLGERTRRRDLWFLAAAGAGLLFFFVGSEAPRGTAPEPARGNLLAALSGAAWALTVMGLRSLGRPGADAPGAAPAVVLGNLLAALFCLPLSLPLRGGPADFLVVLYLGVFQVAGAYLLLTAAIRHVPAAEAALLLLLEPVLSSVWAWLLHGERPGPLQLLGGALILLATTLRALAQARGPAPAAG